MIARTAGNRVGTGMSFFMAGGELGRTVGPMVVAYAVTWWGLDGIWRLAVIGWITSAVLFWRLHNVKARPGLHQQASLRGMLPHVRRIFPTLAWIMGPKALMMASLTVYLPIYMSDVKGAGLTLAAASLALLEGAGFVGALLTGTVSDRIGRARMLLIVLTLAPILLAIFLLGPLWLAVPALIGLGLTAISPTPVMLAVVQDQFPINRATANGLYMFLNFLIRAVAIALVGMMADRLGLTPAFLISGFIALLSIPAVFRLPDQKASV
jgi:FSR family fosmidomycin resistance protein-like MFS transporter